MLNRLIEQRFELSSKQRRKLTHLLFLAISIMTFSVVALTVGNSLFISHAGTEYLPLSYILMGILSIPVYTGLSQIVDTTSRPQLFRYLLLGAIFLAIVLRLLINLDTLPVYYVIHIGFYCQWILVTEVLFPSLISDYFTSLDWKRYAPFLRMAMAVGGLLGGGLTSLLATQIPPEDMLLCLPILYGVVLGQIFYLEHSETQLETNLQEEEGNWLENIKTLPKLLDNYPIILFLATSTFLFIILYSVAEFQYFSIYAQTFANDRELTSFLGLMRVINNIIPFIILYFFTRPLIDKIGVIGMNLVYPLTTLTSFIGLAFNFKLPTAIATNINSNGIEDSLNQPIHTLNYNAVPYSLVGRVRAISNGLFYSLGLATAGILLWLSKYFLSGLQITLIGISLSILFLVIRYLMGKSYLQSLLTMLRSGSVKWDDVSQGLNYLPIKYSPQVHQLLTSSDRHDQILGLELAALLEESNQFLPVVEGLVKSPDLSVRRGIVKFLGNLNYHDF